MTRPEDARTAEFATDGKTDELPSADSRTVNFAGPRPDGTTVALPVPGRPGQPPRGPLPADAGSSAAETVEVASGPRRGFWRELSGALAAGVVILAAVVLVLEVLSWSRGVPGLGWVVLVGHVVGAVLAVVVQRQVDRRVGRSALLAGLLLVAVVAAMLILFWWS